MSLSDFVESTLAISDASSPTVQSLNVGLIAAYHTQYPARVKVYSTSSVLTELVADGFETYSPVYKAAEAYAAAPNAPALFAVGRRALAPTQTLQLACTDGTVGDAYAFTLVGSGGVASQLNYTNVINPGVGIDGSGITLAGDVTLVPGSEAVTFASAQTLTEGELLTFSAQPTVTYEVAAATTASTAATLTAPYWGAASSVATTTVADRTSVTNGLTTVTFSGPQTLAKGSLLMFESQPGVYYALAALVSSSTSGTLTTAYSGTTNAATPTTAVAALAGTFDVINGSATVATTSSQVAGVNPGDSLQFSTQLGTYYTVEAVTASAVTLTSPYSGVTTTLGYASNVCTVSTAAAYLAYLIGLLGSATVPNNIGTVSVINSPAPAFPTVLKLVQVAGALNDVQSWVANGFHNIQVQDVTTDPGIASDLAAMIAADSAAFYGVFLDSNSQAEIEAAAELIEATGTGGKTFWGNTSDYQNTLSSVTTDVFSELELLTLNRSFVQQNDQQLLCFAGAATCGQALAMNPGSYTLAYKSLPLVPADSDTTLTEGQALVINSMTASNPGPGGKKGNYYKTVAGQNWLWPGCAPSGQFFDLTIGMDSLALAIQQAVAATLAGLPKVPFDDFGLQLLGSAIYGVLVLYSTSQYNFILPNGQDPARPIQVNTPTAASLTSAQRASRDVTGFSWSAGLQGAIQNAVLNGKLIP
jgi:hypothetical protein